MRRRWPVALLCLWPAVTQAKSVALDSAYRTRPITIDANLDDWPDALVYVKQANLAVGLVNDRDDLYVCIRSRDPEVGLQILNQGLTAWFGSRGMEGGRLGIEYPLALDRVESLSRSAKPDAPPAGGGSPGKPTRLAIRGPAPGARRIMAVADATGLTADAGASDDAFVYELRMPLARSEEHPYAVGARPGEDVEIVLETPEPTPVLKQRGEGQAGSATGETGAVSGGGGRHGGGGAHGGGTHGSDTTTGSMREENPRLPARLNLTLKVRLAGDTSVPAGPSQR